MANKTYNQQIKEAREALIAESGLTKEEQETVRTLIYACRDWKRSKVIKWAEEEGLMTDRIRFAFTCPSIIGGRIRAALVPAS